MMTTTHLLSSLNVLLTRLLVLASVLLLTACAGLQAGAGSKTFSYSYSAFNFSGAGWEKARRYCSAQNKLAKHTATECGFWTCTSQVECVDSNATLPPGSTSKP